MQKITAGARKNLALRTLLKIVLYAYMNGVLYVSSDGGVTWSQKDIGLNLMNVKYANGEAKLPVYNTTVADMNFYDEKNGMLVFTATVQDGGSRVWCFITKDGGDSWISEELPMGELGTIDKVFLSPDWSHVTLGDTDKKIVVLKRE